MVRFRIRTNWTNSVSKTYEFGLDNFADAAARDRLKWAFSDPERLRPGETRQSLTERAAASFATAAQALRERGHDPHGVAHFVNRLVFCMFADDVGLLPDRPASIRAEPAGRTDSSGQPVTTTDRLDPIGRPGQRTRPRGRRGRQPARRRVRVRAPRRGPPARLAGRLRAGRSLEDEHPGRETGTLIDVLVVCEDQTAQPFVSDVMPVRAQPFRQTAACAVVDQELHGLVTEAAASVSSAITACA